MTTFKTVKTHQGDTWDILAKKIYGDEIFMTELINANIHFRKTVIFSAGVVLNVPDIDTSSKAYESLLPPWKRRKSS